MLDGKLFGKATGSSSFISQFENVLEIPRIPQLYLTDIKILADFLKTEGKYELLSQINNPPSPPFFKYPQYFFIWH